EQQDRARRRFADVLQRASHTPGHRIRLGRSGFPAPYAISTGYPERAVTVLVQRSDMRSKAAVFAGAFRLAEPNRAEQPAAWRVGTDPDGVIEIFDKRIHQ